MKKLSLRARLTLIVSTALLIAWTVATSLTYFELKDSLREIFDSQQLLFAKRLSVLNTYGLKGPMGPMGRHHLQQTSLPKLKSPVMKLLEEDDDALAFAIFDRRGEMLLNDGENGRKFRFNPSIFIDDEPLAITETKHWRIVWLVSLDRRSVIAVGQERAYQKDILHDLMFEQMKPWLVTFVGLILLMILMIGREFKPLQQLSQQIAGRTADDDTPIAMNHAPTEVQPIISALNALFQRILQTIVRERQFISDAAHELRTPLAALKVQTEVAQLSDDDPKARTHALTNLLIGIDRATHLVDQLLTLSRLDTLTANDHLDTLSWSSLLSTAVDELQPLAAQKQILLVRQIEASVSLQGNALLLSVMLRNIIINAIRYIPKQSQITVHLQIDKLTIEDNGPGVPADSLARIGERFYRPPGQKVDGSGLGLSIVKQIAMLHHFSVSFANKPAPEHGFVVTVRW